MDAQDELEIFVGIYKVSIITQLCQSSRDDCDSLSSSMMFTFL